ncbi:MAG TPA: NADH-quinone oxidoreductase subunit C [Verrucomicrobiae bacterium]|nr:NADH-quinone oxidoreductase subunit C [Verrucomicrobiae bacterium]
MKTGGAIFVRNGDPVSAIGIPRFRPEDFREQMLQAVENNSRIITFFGQPVDGGKIQLLAALANDAEGQLQILATEVDKEFPSLTASCAQAHWFEREIAEQWNLLPKGHPWLKPIRFHKPYRIGGGDQNNQIGITNFFSMDGEEIHEVGVGPVHAGIIEPGHFRFQCHGEHVFHLEISLGYQHRGVERALLGGPNKRTVHYVETLAGDATIGHALAYCEGVESLARCRVPARAQVIRAMALELERLANHTGDLGALAGDIGYLPTASYCGRIRGDFLNMTALICGNRFGRGLLRPGGILFDLDEKRQRQLEERLAQARKDVTSAVELLWNSSSVRSRFENAGPLSKSTAIELGLVGVAARASGIERDARIQFPSGIYRFAQIPISSYHTGSVFARAYVRWMEIQRSLAFISDQLNALPPGPVQAKIGALIPDHVVISLTEGWRGEICHSAITNNAGAFAHYKIVDASFHNWMGVAMAMRDQQISDFPLCNKSFNLSYCGHDL